MARFIQTHTSRFNTSPGTTEIEHLGGSSRPCRVWLISWTGDSIHEQEVDDLHGLSSGLDGGEYHWVNITGLEDEASIALLGKEFSLHSLTVEDITNTNHPPKYEAHEKYAFTIMRMLRQAGGEMVSEQVNFILLHRVLLSFQEIPGDVFEAVRNRLRSGRGRVRSSGTAYLQFALMDSLVDNYMLTVEKLGGEIDAMEDDMFSGTDDAPISAIREYTRQITMVRRYVRPVMEMLEQLKKSDQQPLEADLLPFYSDLQDHIRLVNDGVDGYRELLKHQLGMYTALKGYELNEIIKVLTIISTIFIPLSFIAGVYGMNFLHMPELSVPWAYPAVLGGMVLAASTMLILFRRKGWLGGKPKRRARSKRPE
ncbi:magnesium/cobalt transporter CorA [Salinispira pacifica]|uniref:Magnesium transport protein CorA n=1 Tax=Salinispira pacifica TaxID=1307761 RepID=V5WKG3_9SPIO|nr:magnesium/cobalt transporter CorA [Salinispira pacifica]AHC15686.1 Magnesium and cobalt transport protein CorA [Salinispira pacifica]